jgi:hypothetical protein
MNVTSMLSNGYLRPAFRVGASETAAQDARAAALALQEQQILAQERVLKASADHSSAIYHYTVGPDGRRYITSAEVIVTGDERVIDGIPGGVKHRSPKLDEKYASEKPVSEEKIPGRKDSLSKQIEESKIIGQLKQTEREVIAHEAAHMAAGGQFAGSASYTYTEGPDGKKYITGGEVPISVPTGSDPEETARNMEQVVRAALAPANPSGQDLSVAAQAAAAAAQARQQAAARGKEGEADTIRAGVAFIRADIRFERIRSGEEAQSAETDEPVAPDEARDTYARNASQHGMWALGRGFEPTKPSDRAADRLDIAA